ncbi:hypothetical protein DF141_00310 [Burkholderia cenocepacia]|nr:hypothetical protein DF141_00310 [Burkholderia cenocepacia]RQV13834.1 hypothetical protein DF039_22335 [Burkholderia cenocepacia]
MPRFPAMAHKSRSHSNVGIFVHEAYHPQGLSQYDNDLMLRTETTCHRRAIHLRLNFFAGSLCRWLQRPVWRCSAASEEWTETAVSACSDPSRQALPEGLRGVGKSGKNS